MSGGALIGEVGPPDLHVMTFNIRRRIDRTWRRADRWRDRLPKIQKLLREESPTLLGVQEALPDQAAALAEALGREYRFAGHGTLPGPTGEGCPLFYDTRRLELLDWGQTALSDHPDEPGSRSWGNLIPRVLVRAEFRDRATSLRLVALNTHLDPFSRRSRARAAEHIRDVVAHQELPVLVTGDLNARPRSRAITTLLANGALRDAWDRAERRATPPWNTFGAYREPRAGSARIDWIAVTAGVRVLRVAINGRRINGGWPSDHLPVHAVIRLPETGAP
ncbi:endonuclease/exonuclease/phosphatase family protein [Microbacterium sp.]|uniref:endonuclease/exonuclease/phosphatase family protein n=1 Tax=Microbacterium sp. TaxID=51671 RepID=UPI002E36FDD2|nr:endonuclease/exonuclease/phosphatase family protein [Microbacterium sp.]HEX5729140.1 endonuclease/exonuclease/phosphatase family protein [Microbacterium sp.]